MTWLTHDQYPTALANLAALRKNGNAFCWTFDLAHSTHEGRQIAGLRIQGSTRAEGDSRGVLIVAGAHAREMAPPEAALCFAVLLCNAYVAGTGFSFGGKSYSNGIVDLLVEVTEIYIVPLLNVDGRVHVETTDSNWRKNRRPGTCRGVDLNRNHDFLWSSGIGTSTNPCDYQIYRGPSAVSEPETRGVRDLLDAKPHIKGVLDVHSYAGLVLYPWGDDENQSTDSTMSFLNATWDGQRGTVGDAYREFIASGDLGFYSTTATRMRDRMLEVAGRSYVAGPSVGLYPTSGTLDDYGYARHLANGTLAKAMSMTVEIGLDGDGFRPPEPAAQTVRMEGAVAIVEFCLAIMCAGDAVLNARAARSSAMAMRAFRERLVAHEAGKSYVQLLATHAGELATRLSEPELAKSASTLFDVALEWSRGERALDAAVVKEGTALLAKIAKGASAGLKAGLDAARADLARIKNHPADAALAMLAGVKKPRKKAPKKAPKKPPKTKKASRRS